MRWKVAVPGEASAKIARTREKIVNDLADVGALLAEGPKGWLTAYVCVTELVDSEKPAAKLIEAEAA